MIKKYLKILINKPIIFIPSILILLIGYLASYFGQPIIISISGINQLLIIFILSLITLFLISICLTWLLFIIRPSPFKFLKAVIRNFSSILLVIIAYNLVYWIAHILAYSIGKSINLEIETAKILFFLLYVGGLLTILIFFTLLPLLSVYSSKNWKELLKHNFNLTKKNYLKIGTILLILFILQSITNFLPETISIILSLIILPLTALLLADLI